MPKPVKKYRVTLRGLNEWAVQRLAEIWLEAVIEKSRKEKGEEG